MALNLLTSSAVVVGGPIWVLNELQLCLHSLGDHLSWYLEETNCFVDLVVHVWMIYDMSINSEFLLIKYF